MIKFEGSNKTFSTDKHGQLHISGINVREVELEPRGTIILSRADTDEVERILADRATLDPHHKHGYQQAGNAERLERLPPA